MTGEIGGRVQNFHRRCLYSALREFVAKAYSDEYSVVRRWFTTDQIRKVPTNSGRCWLSGAARDKPACPLRLPGRATPRADWPTTSPDMNKNRTNRSIIGCACG